MPGCVAIGCNNRSEQGYFMKSFPRNPELRKIWTDKVSRADWEPSYNSFLCNVHFELDQWTTTQSGRRKLKKNAVPTIFPITARRKSPTKRKRTEIKEEEDIYIIEYLEDPSNDKPTSSAQNLTYNHYTTSNVTTIIRRPPASTKIDNQNRGKKDTTVGSEGTSGADAAETKRPNGVVHDRRSNAAKKNSQVKPKLEMKSPMDSDRELDEIEEKLRSICDGEPQISDGEKMDTRLNNKKIENINGQKSLSKPGMEDICTTGNSSPKENESCSKTQNISATENANNENKSLKFESNNEVEKRPTEKNSINGVLKPVENVEKSIPEISNNKRRSTFTIKLTGIEEDVTDIVEGLGTEAILKYKSSSDLSNSCKNFVTSVISVTDTAPGESENNVEERETEHDRTDSPSNDLRNEISARTKMKDPAKNIAGSPAAFESNENYREPRNRVKMKKDIVKKRSCHFEDSKAPETTINHISTRSQAKRQKISQILCNGECQNDNKEAFINHLSAKLKEANDTIKKITQDLNEERLNMKNSKIQIRQRDNRIKELNWKLNKASKYMERAEKNANTYKKKMIGLQNLLTKKTIQERQHGNPPLTIDTKNFIIPKTEITAMPIDTNNCEYKGSGIQGEEIVYQTVQDIFDEGNYCDDDPIIIDNPEDFMRQFACSL